jgi:FtsP/CotA-like multicopper oxidase with cupredoxin domain
VDGYFTWNFTDVKIVAPAPSRADGVPSGKHELVYPLNGDQGGSCLFNGRHYDSSHPIQTMKLNTLQEWTLDGVQGHPLHIHINPHQIVGLGRVDASGQCDEEFSYFCVGDWHDTLQLPVADGHSSATIRFLTADFAGKQVVHCHYLNHEDLGCIAYMNIV